MIIIYGEGPRNLSEMQRLSTNEEISYLPQSAKQSGIGSQKIISQKTK